MTLSARAQKHLSKLTFAPALKEPEIIRRVLADAGCPPFDALVDFQVRYGGLVEFYGRNRYEWGIVHHAIEESVSPFRAAGKPVVFPGHGGQYDLVCCECHASDTWTLDQDGVLSCMSPMFAAFDTKLEEDALWNELLAKHGKYRDLSFAEPDEQVRATLLPRLAGDRVAEVSDSVITSYVRGGLLVSTRDGWPIDIRLAGEAPAGLLDGLHLI